MTLDPMCPVQLLRGTLLLKPINGLTSTAAFFYAALSCCIFSLCVCEREQHNQPEKGGGVGGRMATSFVSDLKLHIWVTSESGVSDENAIALKSVRRALTEAKLTL